MSTGNIVADYRTKVVTCDGPCQGEGAVYMDEQDMRDYLNGAGFKFKTCRELVKQWKEEGCIPCPKCEGRGRWEVMY